MMYHQPLPHGVKILEDTDLFLVVCTPCLFPRATGATHEEQHSGLSGTRSV